jgi:hypothetical protein
LSLAFSNLNGSNQLTITARQYGEVVFPLFTTKSGMARVFDVMVQILLRAGAIAVQF